MTIHISIPDDPVFIPALSSTRSILRKPISHCFDYYAECHLRSPFSHPTFDLTPHMFNFPHEKAFRLNYFM